MSYIYWYWDDQANVFQELTVDNVDDTQQLRVHCLVNLQLLSHQVKRCNEMTVDESIN